MRIKRGVNAVKKRRKIMRLAKGYFGAKSKLYRVARQAVMKSQAYAYVGRKAKKRDFRKRWWKMAGYCFRRRTCRMCCGNREREGRKRYIID